MRLKNAFLYAFCSQNYDLDSEIYNASARLGEKSFEVYSPYFVFDHSRAIKHNNGVVKGFSNVNQSNQNKAKPQGTNGPAKIMETGVPPAKPILQANQKPINSMLTNQANKQ